MKKILITGFALLIALPIASYGQKIGTVDMNRAFKEYNKTKDAETKILEMSE